ncbi:MAG: MBL fold metallo-hydrolase [Promethearchaeota archaeon]
MLIKILGAESLGVRSLCVYVETKDRKILIDPGIALGYRRFGLLPHPFQVAIGYNVRAKIISFLKSEMLTDIVFSHYHGDHVPLPDANPFQLDAYQISEYFKKPKLWCKSSDHLSRNMMVRREQLMRILQRDLPNSERKSDGPLMFSEPVSHGMVKKNHVMMTRIEENDTVFVHASDIQLLNHDAISMIVKWKPTIVLVSGPPFYLKQYQTKEIYDTAWKNALELSAFSSTLIIDHHLCRSKEGLKFISDLSNNSKNKIICAAKFMNKEPMLLEAFRRELYGELPVDPNWHDLYTNGKKNTDSFEVWRNFKVDNYK